MVGRQATQKGDQNRKAKNEKFGVSVSEDGFEVPFDLITATGFGSFGARASA